jgi:putative ABC transport system substrate-binding protein
MPSAPLGAALRDGLTELDFLEGKNFVFESRWANGEFERLPSLALDLIGRSPAVIVTNTLPAASAAKAALEAGPDVMGRGLEASTLFRKVRP